ncbi:uncharacterized protein LOC118756291 isoform X1 [Rhagoletis pomonella]|uniref:uncharacterized protein LOC118756291 isoform X1 n=2 Tax=Rhagoletis pomonella TaxID=28610 RepID=UPI001783596C|nr:uncharacterized protein LOC118756291 isoform X1 [Rhagoletis pomonella]
MEDGFDDMSSFALMTLDERLIELVRSHKIIYNKQCFGHRGLEQKQAAWNAIGEQLDTTADECAKRWTSLRERYSRELRRLEKLSESKEHVVVDWPYFNSLSFLREFVKPRAPRSTGNETLGWNSPAPPKKFKMFRAESNEFSDTSDSTTPPTKYKSFSAESNEFPDTSDSPATQKNFKILSGESNEFSDASNPLEEICIEKVEMPIEIQNVQSPAAGVIVNTENAATIKRINAVQSFGQTVAAILSEMSEAKQARAMRVLFNALITIKTSPEET